LVTFPARVKLHVVDFLTKIVLEMHEGIIFVTDGDTQHTGFELEWRVLPKMQNVNGEIFD